MNKGVKLNSKGQVTIFIIVAVLIIGGVAAFFVFRDKIGIEKTSVEIKPIQTSILSCLESTTEEGINYIALHGGYYKIPESVSIFYFTDEVPYYYINSVKSIPPIAKIGNELGDYIKDYLGDCINLSSFEEQGFNIKKGNLSVSAIVSESKINVKATYPLLITKEKSTSRLTEFKTSINSNTERLRDASEEIVNLYSENPSLVCLTCLDDISTRYNVEAKATPLSDNNVIWFSIQDSESELNWRFAVEQ